jgi:uncharacterized protein
MSTITCWVVTDGRAGMLNQAWGLAEAIERALKAQSSGKSMKTVLKTVQARVPWRWLPSNLWYKPLLALTTNSDNLSPPWPDLIIGCGRITVPLVRAIGRASKGKSFTVQLQDPRIDPGKFDLVVPPRHDHVVGENVAETTGAVHRVTADKLEQEANRVRGELNWLPHPRVMVLIGGSNKYYKLTSALSAELAERLERLSSDFGAGLLVTASRRTGKENEQVLRKALADTNTVFWDGKGTNPYFAWLGLADAIVVTSDSVSMASEAASTGKPVYVVRLEGQSRKFDEFHNLMQKDGHTRWFTGILEDWQPVRLDDTAKVAAEVIARLVDHQA